MREREREGEKQNEFTCSSRHIDLLCERRKRKKMNRDVQLNEDERNVEEERNHLSRGPGERERERKEAK